MLKICLTGGPCGGKSTSISILEQELTARGYRVFVVSETATELITGGITPSGLAFQEKIFSVQMAKEKAYEEAAAECGTDNTVILCDRGIMDQLAYITKEQLLEIAKKYDLTESRIMANYDAVYHLVTAANGTDCYTKANNPARYESAAEAIKKDNKTIAAWTGHPHLRVIDNSTGFDEKVQRLLDDVFHLLGEPVPSEIERKFLVKKPSLNDLDNIEYISKSDIFQTYLKTEDNIERRVRQRGTKEAGYTFYLTEKKELSPGTRVENEKKITQGQYLNLLMEADTRKRPIFKERYCFLYKNQYFELDVYPFTFNEAILEIELKDISQEVELPDFIEIIREVTDDPNYKNSSLASNFIIK